MKSYHENRLAVVLTAHFINQTYCFVVQQTYMFKNGFLELSHVLVTCIIYSNCHMFELSYIRIITYSSYHLFELSHVLVIIYSSDHMFELSHIRVITCSSYHIFE